MTNITTRPDFLQPAAEMAVDLFDNWFDPIETEVRARSREFIEELLRGELDAALARPRYGRSQMTGNGGRAGVAGHRHGSRTRSLTGTFGPIEIAVPRARLNTPRRGEPNEEEPGAAGLSAPHVGRRRADREHLAGTNTRRVRRALAALFGGAVGKDTVSAQARQDPALTICTATSTLALERVVDCRSCGYDLPSRCASRTPFIRCAVAQFELICRRRHWGEDRVVYAGEDGRLCTISSAFTDVDPADEFRLVAADRAAFRTVDLMTLCERWTGLPSAWGPTMRKADYAAYVKGITPHDVMSERHYADISANILHIAPI